MNIPRTVLNQPGLELLKDAHAKFGPFTRENEAQVKAWIQAERERRGLDSGHYEPPANIRKFEPVDRFDSEDGYR